jgi:lysophospholipase L1-like esterase
MTAPGIPPEAETYNPWSVVNLVFHHLADAGLHPVLGGPGDPGPPAAELLRALGIHPAAEGNRQVARDVQRHLAEIRAAVLDGD